MSTKVQILMSTYNGEKYLEEQLDSILQQSYPDIELLIRDDGSTDSTHDILAQYAHSHSNIKVFFETNVGITNSFFLLLQKSDADYIAFADQDDVWYSDKISAAVDALSSIDGEAMYCSRKQLVDSNLNPLSISPRKIPTPSFENAVVECICTGCTCVINKALAEDIKNKIPSHALLHDKWIYLVASYRGTVIYDSEPHIYYRQHEGNVVGMSIGFLHLFKDKARYVLQNKGTLRQQLINFAQLYHGCTEKDELVQTLINSNTLAGRLRIFFGKNFKRQEKMDQIITKCLYLINMI